MTTVDVFLAGEVGRRTREPIGEEIALEVAQLSPLKRKGSRLSPVELGRLANELAAAPDPIEAARIKERLTRGFYGIPAAPVVKEALRLW